MTDTSTPVLQAPDRTVCMRMPGRSESFMFNTVLALDGDHKYIIDAVGMDRYLRYLNEISYGTVATYFLRTDPTYTIEYANKFCKAISHKCGKDTCGKVVDGKKAWANTTYTTETTMMFKYSQWEVTAIIARVRGPCEIEYSAMSGDALVQTYSDDIINKFNTKKIPCTHYPTCGCESAGLGTTCDPVAPKVRYYCGECLDLIKRFVDAQAK